MRATIFLTVVGLAAAAPRDGVAQGDKPAKLSAEDARQVAALIEQLDSKRFAEREKAMKELSGFGPGVLGALEKAARGRVSLETQRRLNLVIWKLRAPARAEEAKRVAVLIPKLGANRFEERQQATEALVAIGRTGLEQLYAATLSPDIEIVRRADAVISKILAQPNK
jgi:hypothetical protein